MALTHTCAQWRNCCTPPREELYLAIEKLETQPRIANKHAVRVKAINKMERFIPEALAHRF
ncbi:MAG: hypothetical protein R3E39_24930 [Anaerolineae bacterium]